MADDEQRRRSPLCKHALPEKFFDGVFGKVPTRLVNGASQWNFFRTNRFTVLSIATFSQSAFSQQSIQTIFFLHFSRGMFIEELYLPHGKGPDEFRTVIYLRTGLHATTTRHATRKFVGFRSFPLRHFWPRSPFVRSVDR